MLNPKALVHSKQDIVVSVFLFKQHGKKKNGRGCHCKHINMYHKMKTNLINSA